MSLIQGLTGLGPWAFAAALAMTLAAASLRGLTGFGMAIILVPLLGMIMRPDDAVMLAILLQLQIGVLGLRNTIRHSDRSSALPMALCAILTTPLGVWALAHTAPDVARLGIAAISIAAFLLVLLPTNGTAKPGLPLAIGAGGVAGFLTGFAAMPGPPVVPFYLKGGYEVAVARASMMFVFFATAIAATISAWLLGLVRVESVVLSLLLSPAIFLGNRLGGLAFGRIEPGVWRALIGLILGVAGISAAWRAFH